MQDTHARRLPLLVLLFVVGAALFAPPAGAVGPAICSDPFASTGDPDDGDHRELPSMKLADFVMLTQQGLGATASTGPLPPSPPTAAGSPGRATAPRQARAVGSALLRSLVRIWVLHR